MERIGIYSVSNRYIAYLRQDEKLKKVFENKEDQCQYTRKYIGVVFRYQNFNYFIPFSSPKKHRLHHSFGWIKRNTKEYHFIKSNLSQILKNASIIYNQKTKATILYTSCPAPNYLKNTIDFSYAESRCQSFMMEHYE